MGDPMARLRLGGKAADLLGRTVAPSDERIPPGTVPEFASFDFRLFVEGFHGVRYWLPLAQFLVRDKFNLSG
jgi:hypothetical protein